MIVNMDLKLQIYKMNEDIDLSKYPQINVALQHLILRKAKLTAASRTSSILSGFSMVSI